MTDRAKLLETVWRRTPSDLKVTASGMRFVSVGGKLVRLDSMSDLALFTVLRRANVVKTLTTALEAA